MADLTTLSDSYRKAYNQWQDVMRKAVPKKEPEPTPKGPGAAIPPFILRGYMNDLTRATDPKALR